MADTGKTEARRGALVQLTFVTGNPGKLKEARHALAPLGIDVVGEDRGYPEIQADTLQDVAKAGADHLVGRGIEPPFILEDAGLFVTALRGFPGVYSAYTHDTIGCQGILHLLRDVEHELRSATFQANIHFVDADGKHHDILGTCKGRIADRMAGDAGFGFDPIFIPDNTPEGAPHDATFAQLTPDEKQQVSHRGKALAALAKTLQQTAKA